MLLQSYVEKLLEMCYLLVSEPETEREDHPMLQTIISRLQNFRKSLYDLLPQRADSTMDLLDALSSNTSADSVVKLSLNPLFRRCYSSVFDVVENFFRLNPRTRQKRRN